MRLVDVSVTKLAWVEVIANIHAPTIAELTAGIDLSCIMTTAYDVGADGSNTISEQAVCDDQQTDTPTMKKSKGSLVMFRDFTTLGVPGAADPLATFTDDYPAGHFVRRDGLPYDTAWAVGQNVEVYLFTADSPQTKGGTAQGFQKVTVPLLQGGARDLFAVVAAA